MFSDQRESPADPSVWSTTLCNAILTVRSQGSGQDSSRIAAAMRHAVEGGRLAYRAGRIPRRWHAVTRAHHPCRRIRRVEPSRATNPRSRVASVGGGGD
ncbi:MAG: hypothetical protein ABJD24_05755 [Acidimicrobiales bacterium]